MEWEASWLDVCGVGGRKAPSGPMGFVNTSIHLPYEVTLNFSGLKSVCLPLTFTKTLFPMGT